MTGQSLEKGQVFLNTGVLLIDLVRPCLSLCLSNIISLRGCFSTYSSARCMRPKELRRRSLTPLTSVVTSLSSTSGDMPRKRGTISRNTCIGEQKKNITGYSSCKMTLGWMDILTWLHRVYLHAWWYKTWYECWGCVGRRSAPQFDLWLWEWSHTWQRSDTLKKEKGFCVGLESLINVNKHPAEVRREHAKTHLPMRGTEWEVSGIFWAIMKIKTVWASKTEMDTVNFCPPAVEGTIDS